MKIFVWLKEVIKKSLYFKILLYILVFVMLIMFASSSVQYYFTRANTITQINTYYTDSLKQISYSAEFMVSSVRSIASQVYLDSDITPLINSYNPDELAISMGMRKLLLLKNSFTLIQSIYIYNGSNKMFYTTVDTETFKDSDSFFDKDMINILKHLHSETNVKLVARQLLLPGVPDEKKNYTRVFSFIFFDKSHENLDSAIIVNVSEQWLRSVMDSISTQKDGEIFLFDESNNYIGGSSSELALEITENKSLINSINKRTVSYGYYTDKLNGIKYIITFVRSQELNWKFIRIFPFNKLIKQARNAMVITFLISIAFLLFGIFAAYFLSQVIYKPVHKKITALETQLSKNRGEQDKLKNSFLRRLILDSIYAGSKETREMLENYNVKLKLGDKAVIIIFKIDNYDDFCSRFVLRDRDLMKFAILNIAAEILSSESDVETIDNEEDNVVVIYRLNQEFDEAYSEMLAKKLQEILDASFQYLQISLSAAISPAGYFADELENIYTLAVEASNFRFQKGYQSIIFYNGLKILNSGYFTIPDEKCKMLAEYIKLGNKEEAKDVFIQIIESSFCYSFVAIRSAISLITIKIISAVEDIEKSSGTHLSLILSRFVNASGTMETFEKLTATFCELLDNLEAKLNERKLNKHNELLDTINDIIIDNYANGNLCTDFIADKLGMSAAYIGRIIKKHTSKSLTSLILETRFQKAKELLEGTEKPVIEIAQLVGYDNTKYFFTAFKKTYGITPHEYRTKFKKQAHI